MTDDPWARLARATGICGLTAFVLVFVPITAVSSLGEPSLTATAGQADAFFARAAGTGWVGTANAVVVLAALVLVWFVAARGPPTPPNSHLPRACRRAGCGCPSTGSGCG